MRAGVACTPPEGRTQRTKWARLAASLCMSARKLLVNEPHTVVAAFEAPPSTPSTERDSEASAKSCSTSGVVETERAPKAAAGSLSEFFSTKSRVEYLMPPA